MILTKKGIPVSSNAVKLSFMLLLWHTYQSPCHFLFKLLSKQKGKAPIWQYFRFKLNANIEPDNIHEEKVVLESWR